MSGTSSGGIGFRLGILGRLVLLAGALLIGSGVFSVIYPPPSSGDSETAMEEAEARQVDATRRWALGVVLIGGGIFLERWADRRRKGRSVGDTNGGVQ